MFTMQSIVFYLGSALALLILVVGLICAIAVLLGQKDWVWRFLDRVWPALAIMFGSTVVAGLLLMVVRWFTGMGA